MAFLAWDSDFAFVTDEGAAFHTWTDGYWKLLSLNLLEKPALSLILFCDLVDLLGLIFTNNSLRQ